MQLPFAVRGLQSCLASSDAMEGVPPNLLEDVSFTYLTYRFCLEGTRFNLNHDLERIERLGSEWQRKLDVLNVAVKGSPVEQGPKFHKVCHWVDSIREFCGPSHYVTESFESAHKETCKKWKGSLSFRGEISSELKMMRGDMLYDLHVGDDSHAAATAELHANGIAAPENTRRRGRRAVIGPLSHNVLYTGTSGTGSTVSSAQNCTAVHGDTESNDTSVQVRLVQKVEEAIQQYGCDGHGELKPRHLLDMRRGNISFDAGTSSDPCYRLRRRICSMIEALTDEAFDVLVCLRSIQLQFNNADPSGHTVARVTSSTACFFSRFYCEEIDGYVKAGTDVCYCWGRDHGEDNPLVGRVKYVVKVNNHVVLFVNRFRQLPIRHTSDVLRRLCEYYELLTTTSPSAFHVLLVSSPSQSDTTRVVSVANMVPDFSHSLTNEHGAATMYFCNPFIL
jgi:hypothetical protein